MGMTWKRHGAHIYGSRRWKGVRVQVLRRDGWRCVSCGSAGRLEVDHVKPIRDGGAPYDMSNLQALCPSCHTRKTRLECGHPELSPARQAWRDLLKATGKRGTQCLIQ